MHNCILTATGQRNMTDKNLYHSDTVGCGENATSSATKANGIKYMLYVLQWIDGSFMPLPEWHGEIIENAANALHGHDCETL